jgi:hypothetical protein
MKVRVAPEPDQASVRLLGCLRREYAESPIRNTVEFNLPALGSRQRKFVSKGIKSEIVLKLIDRVGQFKFNLPACVEHLLKYAAANAGITCFSNLRSKESPLRKLIGKMNHVLNRAEMGASERLWFRGFRAWFAKQSVVLRDHSAPVASSFPGFDPAIPSQQLTSR